MCTVTYIPISVHNKGISRVDFLLTSNRDESTKRSPAMLPEIFHINNKKVAVPFDPVGKGSWIALEENGRTICLLNGGFVPHLPQPPYRHSRGLVVTKYFNYRNVNDFVELFDFSQLEPFTLVVVEANELYELRWDGTQHHLSKLNQQEAYIWSSVTLYSPDTRLRREWLFAKWLSENQKDLVGNPNLVLDFHNFKDGNEEGIAINRDNRLRTVSITAIKKVEGNCSMLYTDVIHDQTEIIKFGTNIFKTAI
jgi:uncharacterized protein with NRDE domain